jgi:hypothetical protein
MGGNFQSTTTNSIDGNNVGVVGEADVYFIKNFYLPAPGGATQFSFCKDGKPMQLVASGNGVKWFADSLLTQQVFAGNNFTTQIDSAVTYYVLQTQGGAKSSTKKVTAFSFALTPISLTQSGDTLFVSSTQGKQYKWYKNGTLMSGKTTSSIVIASTGNYHALMIDGNACINYTDTINMQVTGLFESSEIQVSLYPNPANDMLYLTSDENITELNFYNLSGILVNTLQGQQLKSCSLNNLTNGLYMVQVKSNNGVAVKRILIQHQLK